MTATLPEVNEANNPGKKPLRFPEAALKFFANPQGLVLGRAPLLGIVVAGGKVEREKMSIGEYGFIVLALDTEGNMFGLHSLK